MVTNRAFYKTLLRIALPMAFQSLVSLAVSLLDNIMVGQLGETAISAVSISNQLAVFLAYFGMGLVGGLSVLMSQYWGKRDMERIKTIFAMALQIGLCVSFLAMLAVRLFPVAALSLISDNRPVIAEAVGYITIACFSYVFFIAATTMSGMLRCVEVVRVSLAVAVFSFFVNLVGNYVLIFGKFGFPAMGIRGAAVATVIARVVECAVVFVYMLFVQKVIVLRPRDFLRRDMQLIADWARHGLPILLGDMQWGFVGVLKSSIIGRLGTSMISANNVADVLMQLGMVFSSGLSGAACVVIGKTIGQGDLPRVRQYSNTIQVLFCLVGVCMAAVVFFGRGLVVSLYAIEETTRQLARTLIAIGAFTLIGTTYHAACFTGINRGAGDGRFVVTVDMICGWLVVLPLAALSAFVWHWPLPVTFLMIRIDQCFKWLIAFYRLRGNRWIHSVTRA